MKIQLYNQNYNLTLTKNTYTTVYRLDPLDMSNGIILGHQTSARLNFHQVREQKIFLNVCKLSLFVQMYEIAKRRGRGISPMRPQIKTEFALAIIWAEAALIKATNESADENLIQIIEKDLHWLRCEHNKHWISPQVDFHIYLINYIQCCLLFRVSLETIQMRNSFIRE